MVTVTASPRDTAAPRLTHSRSAASQRSPGPAFCQHELFYEFSTIFFNVLSIPSAERSQDSELSPAAAPFARPNPAVSTSSENARVSCRLCCTAQPGRIHAAAAAAPLGRCSPGRAHVSPGEKLGLKEKLRIVRGDSNC